MDTNSAKPRVAAVPHLVETQASLKPDGLAVCAGSDCLSYGELNFRANRLARHLRSSGVIRGNIVAVCLERSVQFPVACLAVLKLGAAYLPIDPNTPPDRLRMMLHGAGVSTVVTQASFAEAVAREAQIVVALDREKHEIDACSPDSLGISVTRDTLAYVIYTSGSTGTPKGAALSHGNLLNLVSWHNRAFHVTAEDRVSQVASIGFDATVWEIWPNLVAGASVHFADEQIRTDPEMLRDWLVRENITVSFVSTPLAERMIKFSWPRETKLKFLLTGADTLHYYPPAGLPFEFVNNYGPTECTVVATSGVISPNAGEDRLPPIGRPIDNTNIYILDKNGKQSPAGKIGEMYIGGASVGSGYLNDPQLTAERFVRDPFSSDKDARLYRTGDLACWLADGQIAFHGRIDDQVKIRGHRIELNEIIAALDRYPAVRESVVTATEDGMGDKRLIAYIVRRDSTLTLTEIRDFLGRTLPTYMIPSTFVAVEAIPLGASGKINRSALPAPTDQNILRDEEFVRAKTATEERVAEIVTSLLGLDSIGMNDNFFYLGGNSLFGTQVIARVRESFDVEVPLLRLFDCSTVEALASEVDQLLVTKIEEMTEDEAQRLLELNTQQSSL